MSDSRPSGSRTAGPSPPDVERAGDAPTPPSSEGIDRLLEALLVDVESVSNAYVVRAALVEGSDRSTGRRLVDAIEDQLTVVGSSLDEGLDPAAPEIDVLVDTDYPQDAVAASLGRVGPVDGVAVVDATGAAERVLAAGESPAEPEPADEPAGEGADANEVFSELQEEVDQLGYSDVVEELEDVEFAGGPDPADEVDLEAETGVALDDEDGTATAGEPAAGEPATEEPAAGKPAAEEPATGESAVGTGTEAGAETEEGYAFEDREMAELLGEDDGESTDEAAAGGGPDKAADEQAIEEAVKSVELDDAGADDEPEPDPGDDSAATSTRAGGTGAAADSPGAASTGDDSGTASTDAAPEATSTDDGSGRATTDAGSGQATTGAAPAGGAGEAATGEARSGRPQWTAEDVDAFVGALAEALEAGAVDEARRSQLRDALDLGRDDEVAELRAELDGLAERVQRAEGGQEVDAIEARLDTLETRVEELESTVDRRLDAFEDGLRKLGKRVETLLNWRQHVEDVLSS